MRRKSNTRSIRCYTPIYRRSWFAGVVGALLVWAFAGQLAYFYLIEGVPL
jgi:hypothetical protein